MKIMLTIIINYICLFLLIHVFDGECAARAFCCRGTAIPSRKNLEGEGVPITTIGGIQPDALSPEFRYA